MDVLYSNDILLKKYNKEIPKTWDELLKTKSEEGQLIIYEFINSYRETLNSPFPKIKSKETFSALQSLKNFVNSVSSDSEWRSNEDLIFYNFLTGNSIFIKYWYSKHYTSLYTASPLPCGNFGISGSVISSYNVAVNKYIDETNKNASVEVLKFITSKEIQRDLLISEEIFSPIVSLYDDDEVCEIINCELIKSIQPFSIVNMIYENDYYDLYDYSRKYKSYIYEFIKGNKTVDEVIKKLDNLTRFYNISFKTDDSLFGLIVGIIYFLVTLLLILSLVYLFVDKYQNLFSHFDKDFWILSIIGCVVIMSSVLTFYGEISSLKCHLRRSLISLGFIFSITPMLHKLISNYPNANKISLWVNDYKYKFLMTVTFMDIFLNSLLAISSYNIKNVVVSHGKIFHKCDMKSLFGIITLFLIALYEISLLFSIIFFVIKEWSLDKNKNDKIFFLTAVSEDILSIILYHILSMTKIEDFIACNTILITNIFIFTITKYICIYGVKLIAIFKSELKEKKYGGYIPTLINSSDIKNDFFYRNRVSKFSSNAYSNGNGTYSSLSCKKFDLEFKEDSDQPLELDISEYIDRK
ncbi:hypothetical protein U3516DRAFT_627930 [Neocallimastix sp. 'constans']